MGLTPEQIGTIKATVPVLVEHGETITNVFYKNMIDAHPSLKTIFNHANQVNFHQPRALAGSLYAYAAHIDDLGALGPLVELISAKHASLYVRPEQYEIVGTHLLGAMKQILGEAMTPEIYDAWAAAYWQLADILIKREAQHYKSAGTWTDWRDFRIAKKIPESDEVTSFYLEPVNGGKLPEFLPGQYISVQMDVPVLGHPQSRQYSLSDAPRENYYRISVKKESGLDVNDPKATPNPGLISNILHETKNAGDVIKVSHPFGDFFLNEELASSETPLVLIGAGVGLTPLMSILNNQMARNSSRPISWIHAARSEGARAFKGHVEDIIHSKENVHAVFFTGGRKPTVNGSVNGTVNGTVNSTVNGTVNGAVNGAVRESQYPGQLDFAKLDAEKDLFLNDPTAQYFICGPTGFMLMSKGLLKEKGVPEERIHLELFGTGGVPQV